MPAVKLIPSHYDRSNTSYVTVTDAANMYADASNTAGYATLRGRTRNSASYYAFINGFDFTQVPNDATVNSFTIRIRCYRNQYEATGSTSRVRLASSASNNNVIANTTATTDIGTAATVITIPTGSITWNQLVSWGAGFSIEVVLKNTSTASGRYPYVYVYGAEIEVDYTPAAPGGPDIYSNYYIRRVAGGWSPCVEGNNAHGLLPFAGSVLPNCSGFATGRFNELLSMGDCTYLGSADGGNFMNFAGPQGLNTGSTPQVGAAIVWKNSGEGHVAIVEQIISPTEIICSESGWDWTSNIWEYRTHYYNNGRWHWNLDYNFQGFIYPPGIAGEDDEDEYYYIMFMQDK